jgi:hypothetical protein
MPPGVTTAPLQSMTCVSSVETRPIPSAVIRPSFMPMSALNAPFTEAFLRMRSNCCIVGCLRQGCIQSNAARCECKMQLPTISLGKLQRFHKSFDPTVIGSSRSIRNGASFGRRHPDQPQSPHRVVPTGSITSCYLQPALLRLRYRTSIELSGINAAMLFLTQLFIMYRRADHTNLPAFQAHFSNTAHKPQQQ